MKRNLVVILAVFVIATLACSLGQRGEGGAPQEPGVSLLGQSRPSQPVSISEGLASLNSYRATISITTIGPNPQSSTVIVYETQRSKDQNARYTKITSTSSDQDESSGVPSNYEMYRIGNDQCVNSGDQWSYTSMPANVAEMMDLVMGMFSVTPVIDNPTFVAEETVNNIATNHFSFKVAGLGVKSGANVTINQGDYWLAVDGQYIVKYSLVVETVLDPQNNTLHMETKIEVTDINQPITIALPQDCLEAKAESTPAP